MIIAISGKAQSGKDTICSMIQYCIWYYNEYVKYKNAGFDCPGEFGVEHFEYCKGNSIEMRSNFYKHSFAEYLKRATAAILDYEREDLEDIKVKNSTITWLPNGETYTVRMFLQDLGTAVREHISPFFWAYATLKSYSHNNFKHWIIPDLRYSQEVDAIRDVTSDVVLIRVENPNVVKMDHSSETALDYFDDWNYIVDNSGTKEDLLYKVRDIVLDLGLIKL